MAKKKKEFAYQKMKIGPTRKYVFYQYYILQDKSVFNSSSLKLGWLCGP